MIFEKLIKIQQELNAPKDLHNDFGNYYYRSCESILAAVKPFLGDCFISLTDELIYLGDRYYIKATATISDGKESLSTTALAREEETKKGMDAAQITGSASSYARKYALNGLFAIDDTKDSDYTNHETKANGTKKVADPIMEATAYADKEKKVLDQLNPDTDHKCLIHNVPMTHRFSEKKQKTEIIILMKQMY